MTSVYQYIGVICVAYITPAYVATICLMLAFACLLDEASSSSFLERFKWLFGAVQVGFWSASSWFLLHVFL